MRRALCASVMSCHGAWGSRVAFGACVGHALRWKIKSKSAAARLRRAAAGEFAGLPMNRATIRLVGGCGSKKRV